MILLLPKVGLALFTGLFFLFATNPAQAESPELRGFLFKEADAALKAAQEMEAVIYAPTTFAAGMNYYRKAEAALGKGDEIKEIERNVAAAAASFSKSTELARHSTTFFSSVISARRDARQAEADRYAAEAWKKAESRLSEAIKTLEEGDDSAARARGVASETAYRDVELKAIKVQCLKEAAILLEKAEKSGVKENAPLTWGKAAATLEKAEKTLEANRRDRETARKLALQAQYETNHAIYLSQTISRLLAEEKSFEEILLAAELPLTSIAQALGKPVYFDHGVEPATREIIDAIRNLK